MNIQKFIFGLLVMALSFLIDACPCGCGSSSPLSLSAYESWKVFTSYSREYDTKRYDLLGNSSPLSSGPRVKNTYELMVAKSITDRSAFSVGTSVTENGIGDQWDSSIGDPVLGLSYLVYKDDFFSYLPNLALLTSYKISISKNKMNEGFKRKAEGINIHGNGFDEMTLGYDALWHFRNFEPQVTQFLLHQRERENKNDSSWHKRGDSLVTQVGFSAYSFGLGSLSFALRNELKAKDTIDDVLLEKSNRIKNVMKFGLSFRVGIMQTFGVSYEQAAPFLKQQSAMISKRFGISFSKSI